MELTISSIANNRNIPSPKYSAPRSFGLKPYKQLTRDTVSFGSLDLMKRSPRTILRIVNDSILPENRIGSGGEASVYRIPETNYCFRRIHYEKGEPLTEISLDITEEDRINHNVARIGEGSSIKKYIEGKPVAMPYMPIEEQQQIAKEIADMPVSAFRKLIGQISYAYQHKMMFDDANGNIIVNPKDQTLTAIDFYKMTETEALNPLCFLFESLKSKGTSLEQQKTIAGKLMLATLEEFKPGTKPCLAPVDFDLTRFSHKLFNSNVIENTNFRSVFIKTLENIHELKIKEFQGKPKTAELLGQQKVAKVLIKQLLHVTP